MRPRAPSTGGSRTPAGAGPTRPRGRRWARPGLRRTRPAPGWPGRRRVRRRVRAWHRGWPPGPSRRRRAAGAGLGVGAAGAGSSGTPDGSGVGEGAEPAAGSWPAAPSPGSPGFVSAHWLPLSLAAICCPVARPGGRAPGTWPSMGQRSPVAWGEAHLHEAAGLELDGIVLVGHRLQVGDGRLLLGRRRVGVRDGLVARPAPPRRRRPGIGRSPATSTATSRAAATGARRRRAGVGSGHCDPRQAPRESTRGGVTGPAGCSGPWDGRPAAGPPP